MEYPLANPAESSAPKPAKRPALALAALPRLDALSWVALALFTGYLVAGLLA